MSARSERPMHAVVRADLHDAIRAGRFQPGDQVPTEPQLMERYEVSRTTVRRALRDLETLGLIVRQPGRGSFVSQPAVETRLDRLTGFVEDMEALGLTATASVELVETVPHRTARPRRCGAPSGSRWSTSSESAWPTARRSRSTTATSCSPSGHGSPARTYGTSRSTASSSRSTAHPWPRTMLRATLADRRVAGHLHIAPGDPVLLIERTRASGLTVSRSSSSISTSRPPGSPTACPWTADGDDAGRRADVVVVGSSSAIGLAIVARFLHRGTGGRQPHPRGRTVRPPRGRLL